MARSSPDVRLIAAIAAPTRAFAAAFSATGVVAARAETLSQVDGPAHLAFLKMLPPNTTVTYHPNAVKSTIGWLRGFFVEGDTEYVDIITEVTRLAVPVRYAHRIEVAPRQLAELPVQLRYRTVRAEAGLMAGVLDSAAAAQFIGQTSTECMIVGNEGRLHAEIVQSAFSIQSPGNRRIAGTLQHIVRARPWCSRFECARSQVLSAARPLPRHQAGGRRLVAVFDGSASFLKWKDIWSQADWIVLMDRTEPRFADCVSELEGMYASRSDGAAISTLPALPVGSEALVFAESR